jgi:hypothetical protein
VALKSRIADPSSSPTPVIAPFPLGVRFCFRSPGRPRPRDGERIARLAFGFALLPVICALSSESYSSAFSSAQAAAGWRAHRSPRLWLCSSTRNLCVIFGKLFVCGLIGTSRRGMASASLASPLLFLPRNLRVTCSQIQLHPALSGLDHPSRVAAACC